MHHVNIDTVVNEFMEEFFGALDGLYEDEDGGFEAFLDGLTDGDEFAFFAADE